MAHHTKAILPVIEAYLAGKAIEILKPHIDGWQLYLPRGYVNTYNMMPAFAATYEYRIAQAPLPKVGDLFSMPDGTILELGLIVEPDYENDSCTCALVDKATGKFNGWADRTCGFAYNRPSGDDVPLTKVEPQS